MSSTNGSPEPRVVYAIDAPSSVRAKCTVGAVLKTSLRQFCLLRQHLVEVEFRAVTREPARRRGRDARAPARALRAAPRSRRGPEGCGLRRWGTGGRGRRCSPWQSARPASSNRSSRRLSDPRSSSAESHQPIMRQSEYPLIRSSTNSHVFRSANRPMAGPACASMFADWPTVSPSEKSCLARSDHAATSPFAKSSSPASMDARAREPRAISRNAGTPPETSSGVRSSSDGLEMPSSSRPTRSAKWTFVSPGMPRSRTCARAGSARMRLNVACMKRLF